ncbi:MAG: hypothetical protein E6R08_08575 [Nevskiaceae bacterium]|nr:MAG: hypothetical protein E6R08_08575 [Nevskiaceae bacterium]
MTDASIVSADKNKEAAGGVSCLLWIGTGIYYFATTDQASFFSWQALVFFIGGAFGSALLIGASIYYLFEAHRKFVHRRFRSTLWGTLSAVTNLALNVLQFVVPVVAAKWVFYWLLDVPH